MDTATEQPPRHKQTNRWLIPGSLLVTVVFVAANALGALRSVEWLEKSENWVNHTWEVVAKVERLMSSAKDAETGSRGFLLTGDEAFLEPYHDAVKALPSELDEFVKVTQDNPGQQERAAQMRAVMEQRLALLAQANSLRTPGGSLDSVRAMVVLGNGRQTMDRMRRIADGMEGEERRLLADRIHVTHVAARRVRYTLGLASFLDFLFIVFVFRYFVRERGLRVAGEMTAARLAQSRAELQEKATEVIALNESLELRVRQRTAELEATNRELEAFSYSVSHDLRAPLRTIDGFSLALEEDYAEVVGKEGKDYIARVRAGVQRMGGLIDALLQLSRITRAGIEREDVDVTGIAESVAGQIQEQNPGQKIEFVIQPNLRADADPKLFRVALENLFGNAVKFSSKKDASLVEFGWDEIQNAWFVRDNGAGFDMHYKNKLFGAFNRLHGDKDFKGSGIGLATVARVITRHHGRIWADSVLEQGATFWFTLNQLA